MNRHWGWTGALLVEELGTSIFFRYPVGFY